MEHDVYTPIDATRRPPVASQPCDLAGGQHQPPVEEQRYSPEITYAYQPAGVRPYQPVGAQPYQPVGARPYQPVGAQPYQPLGAQPYQPVGAQPYQPVGAQPYQPVGAQPYQPVSAQPYQPVAMPQYMPMATYPYAPMPVYPYVPPVPQRTPAQKLRRESNIQGGALLIYFGIMNAAVILVTFLVSFIMAFRQGASGESDMQSIMDVVMDASGWGYFLAIAAGMMALLLWKKPRYLRDPIWKKGKTMTVGSFFILLTLAMAPQLLGQLTQVGLDWLIKLGGVDPGSAEATATADAGSLSMFLYVGILAPITEELLFRGLVMRSFEPYGKKMAIFVSAILFGLFHGNPIQTPYALLVGIVLGYVAMEYHVVWAIALHMFNNLGFALLLPRVLAFLPAMLVEWIFWAIIIAFFLAAVLILAVKHEKVIADWRQEHVDSWKRSAVFGSPTIIILIVICGVNIALTTVMMFA